MVEKNKETINKKEGKKTQLNLTKYKLPRNVPTISYCIFNMKQFNIKQ